MKHAKISGLLATLGIASATAACGGAAPSPAAAALAYMQAHKVPAVAGMTAGVVLASNDVGFFGTAARQAQCPATLTAFTAGAAGGQPLCGAFDATVETPSGQVVAISCGSIAGRTACPPMLTAPGVYIPSPGDYIRFRDGGVIAASGDIQGLAMFAVNVPLHDTGGPVWVTAPASGGGQ
jgi:hypothetical protein